MTYSAGSLEAITNNQFGLLAQKIKYKFDLGKMVSSHHADAFFQDTPNADFIPGEHGSRQTCSVEQQNQGQRLSTLRFILMCK